MGHIHYQKCAGTVYRRGAGDMEHSFDVARWHKRNGYKAPRKFTGAIETLITFVYDGVIRPTLKDRAMKFAPYLLTVFFFILYMNLLGLIVVFPRRRESDRQHSRHSWCFRCSLSC